MQDRIERVVMLPVPVERAWTAITDPREMERWFGDRIDMTLEVGAEAKFCWSDMENRARVAVVDPPRLFAYEWHPGTGEDRALPLDQQPLTLVEFHLEPAPGGTKLTLVESGFAALPEAEREAAWKDNSGGWDEELGHLVAFAGTLAGESA